MSNYETSGPGGVGKRYGPLEPGAVGGKIGGVDASQQAQFMLKAGEDSGLAGQAVQIPPYSRITKVEALVIVANDTATAKVGLTLDGTTILDVTDIAVDAAAGTYTDETLSATVADLLVGDTAEELLAVPDANALLAEAGECVITVTYTTA